MSKTMNVIISENVIISDKLFWALSLAQRNELTESIKKQVLKESGARVVITTAE